MHIDGGPEFLDQRKIKPNEINTQVWYEQSNAPTNVFRAFRLEKWKHRKSVDGTFWWWQIVSPWLDGIVDGATDMIDDFLPSNFIYFLCVRWPHRLRTTQHLSINVTIPISFCAGAASSEVPFLFYAPRKREKSTEKTLHISLLHLFVIIQNSAHLKLLRETHFSSSQLTRVKSRIKIIIIKKKNKNV